MDEAPTDPLSIVERLWQDGDSSAVDRDLLPAPHRRLLDALADEKQPGSADLACLLRHVLGWESARSGGGTQLRIGPGRLDRANLEQAGLATTVLADGRLSLSVRLWVPPGCEGQDPLREIYREGLSEQSRISDEVPADPFWRAYLGYAAYQSRGQRQIARSIVSAPPGGSLIVSLPTGTGKTSLALGPALMRTQAVGVAVVIVPTTVLAVDQERRLRELIAGTGQTGSPSGRYAYLGELSEEVKQEIRSHVRAGTQRVVFTSPEGAVGGLAAALHDAAQGGFLTHFVVDEAHVVDQWGTEFRPEFQTMGALRRLLVDAAPPGRAPVTLLMSATLGSGAVTALRSLLTGPGPVRFLASSVLRGEFEYFIAEHDSEAARAASVLDALHHLPRPAVLYVSTHKQIQEWTDLLKSAGYLRVAAVHSNVGAEQRGAIVEAWRGSPGPARVDLVLATSAFGLGVDVPNVRAVVHACIPETVDRYYQEVGRSGRDGRPSAAFLSATFPDRHTAARLNKDRVISLAKGLNRWNSMLQGADQLDAARYRVNLDARPPNVHITSDENMRWNLRTLTLMQRAGLVQLTAERFASGAESAADVEPIRSLVVEILNETHADSDGWQHHVEPVRADIAANSQRSLTAMHHLLEKSSECVGRSLADYYTWRAESESAQMPASCRGCPSCRAARRTAFQGLPPLPQTVFWPDAPALDDGLPRAFSVPLQVTDGQYGRQQLQRVLVALLRRGHTHLIDPGRVIDDDLAQRLQRKVAPVQAVLHDVELDPFLAPQVPRVWLIDPRTAAAPDLEPWRFDAQPIVVLHPEDLPDRLRPHQLWSVMNPPSVRPDRLLEVL